MDMITNPYPDLSYFLLVKWAFGMFLNLGDTGFDNG